MNDATDPMDRLVRYALAVSRQRGLTADRLAEDIAAAVVPGDADQPAAAFLERLAAHFATPGRRLHVTCEPDLRLAASDLAAVGIVAGEAMSNSLTHAFPGGRDGDIWLRLFEKEGRIRLVVRDNGVGIPDILGGERSGRGLIDAVAHLLGGYARLGSAAFGGAEVLLVFAPKAAARAA